MPPRGSKHLLSEVGPEAFARWMRESKSVGVTDTTFRDAHQSLLATRIRTSGPRRYSAEYRTRLLAPYERLGEEGDAPRPAARPGRR